MMSQETKTKIIKLNSPPTPMKIREADPLYEPLAEANNDLKKVILYQMIRQAVTQKLQS